MTLSRFSARLAAPLVILLACGGEDLFLPAEGEPAAIAVVQGNDQVGRVGEALAEPVVARVTDTRGRPVVDVPVSLRLENGPEAEVAPAGARSDTDGTAAFQVVLGGNTGTLEGRVVVDPADGEPRIAAAVRFTSVSADASGIGLAGGDGQSAPAGTPLPDPLVVQVADVFGNPIAGVPIGWEVEGGGTVSSTVTETDADGRTSVERTLGPAAGVQRTRASAAGLVGSPVTFTHTATAGSAARLEAVSGDGQSAVVGTPLGQELVVRLLDPAGNPVTGRPVAWIVGEGGGSVAPQTVPTDAEGRAATQWTLGTSAGTQTLTAVVSGVGTVTFTATALPGTPPGLRLVTQPAATAQRGIVLGRQPAVQLVDPSGGELAQGGVPVTAAVAAGGGQVRGTLTRATGSDGRASFTDLALEGPAGRYTLAFTASGYSSALSEGIELARAATTTSITSHTPDPSAPGAVVRVVFTVTSAGGLPAGTVAVRADDGATCAASVGAGACSLALTRTGSQQITVAYQGNEEFEPSQASSPHLVETPPAPALVVVTQPSGTAAINVPFSRQPAVQLRDGGGSDVRTAGVVITAGIASGTGTLIGPTTGTTDAAGRATWEGLGIAGGTGSHILRFTADGYLPAASDAIQVEPAPTTLVIESDDPDPSSPGETVQVRYRVTSPGGTPVGEVTVSAGGATCSGTVAAAGCGLALPQPGSYTITASYAGGGGFAAAGDTEPHTVSEGEQPPPPTDPSATSSSVGVAPATVRVGERATVEVTVRSAAGQALAGVSVQLSASGSGNTVEPPSATTNGAGLARFTLASSVAESKTITAVAGGVTLQQQPTLTVTRRESSTRIVSHEPEPSEAGQAIEVRVRVEGSGGTPGGSVSVSAAGGLACTASLSDGAGSCTITPGTPGTITIAAEYSGDAAFGGSSTSVQHEVRAPEQRVLVLRAQPASSAAPGEDLGEPEVQLALEGGGEIRESGVVIGAAIGSGGGSLTGTTSVATGGNGRARFGDLAIDGPDGTYTIVFSADGYGSVASAPIEIRRTETGTDITDQDPEPSAPGEAVEVAFRVSGRGGTPTGTVQVSAEGSGPSCTGTLAGGEGSCTLTFAEAGEFTLTPTYSGDARFAPSTGAGERHRVEAPNGSPTAGDDEVTVLEDSGPLEVASPGVLSNDGDPDGDPLTAGCQCARDPSIHLLGSDFRSLVVSIAWEPL